MQAKQTSVAPAYGFSKNAKEHLTPLRQHVLALIKARGGQATAYELVADLSAEKKSAAPATIYRALHYLIERGDVRRIATTSTFIISERADGRHQVVMVCTHCGAIMLVHDDVLHTALVTAAHDSHFLIVGQETEVKGICQVCTDAGVGENSNSF
ncbi:Fur family transcriptional regulator [Caballeronia sordidicola]|uniref:Zinc uptake regulation protein ZUR n=1 Tax=Caballeronia sordidicola TaxID=196367 RepID=A0A226X4Y0_CABSO|nr:transcriptional repressor [Caballeronia sordidicola]OXC78050.1 Zinc uptake regulation protein ZUR [Caballeronia sordidicola]